MPIVDEPEPSHQPQLDAAEPPANQLARGPQAMQRACWDRSLSAELSGLILGKTSRYNVRMVDVSCPLLRDTAKATRADQVWCPAVATNAG